MVQLKELFSEGALPMGAISTLAELTCARVGDKSSMVASEAVTLLKELAKFAWAVLYGTYETMAGSDCNASNGGSTAAKSMGLNAAHLLATIEQCEARVKVGVAPAACRRCILSCGVCRCMSIVGWPHLPPLANKLRRRSMPGDAHGLCVAGGSRAARAPHAR